MIALRRRALAAGVGLLLSLASERADAFCGFYVAGADAKLFAEASQVVLMREGTRTVLSMQNDYQGPLADFAMVVPVPVVLQKENVKTLKKDVFARVDRLSAPRLVEYWERDPCAGDPGIGLGNIGTIGHGAGMGTGQGFGAARGAVTVEAQFEVGEYEIVILSTKDASALEPWLAENGYRVPAGSEPFFRPYVQAGSKFFVAKVNAKKVAMEDGVATLSPLRFHYDSERFELPVRLGLVNSKGTQDLIVHVLADRRYEVANYPNVTIPTNLDVSETARASFGEVYAALFDRTLAENPKAVVTEYAWPSSSCDPCPGGSSGLSAADLATLGTDVLPSSSGRGLGTTISGGGSSVTVLDSEVTGALRPEIVRRVVRSRLNQLRFCYEAALVKNPALAGTVKTRFVVDAAGKVKNVADASSDLRDPAVLACMHRAFGQMTFPPESERETTVTWAARFSPGQGGMGPRGGGPSLVLTRLHARYGKDSLGADLVFKEAEPIVGGREIRSEAGSLETGAVKSTMNSFQARYAIRHAWPGKIACESPRRGVWGGPWAGWDAGAASPSAPVAATKLAYAPRGRIDVSKVFGDLGSVAAASAAEDAGATASDGGQADAASAGATGPASSKCGCRTPGGGAPFGTGAILGLALAASAIVRRLVCSRR